MHYSQMMRASESVGQGLCLCAPQWQRSGIFHAPTSPLKCDEKGARLHKSAPTALICVNRGRGFKSRFVECRVMATFPRTGHVCGTSGMASASDVPVPMSGILLFSSGLPPSPEVPRATGGRGVMTQLRHSGNEVLSDGRRYSRLFHCQTLRVTHPPSWAPRGIPGTADPPR
jgi:hypothetical protein